ncbi:glutathione S-transferase [Infundibulicybe gibba]|nr:glutathione S-transferase [Infundibulicybe gibba]
MVLKLYGVPFQTSPSGLVALVLNENKVPFEFVPIDMPGGAHKTPEYRKHNPFDDDGFILYESRAICRYISMKYGKQGASLLPPADDVKAIALFEQAASVEVTTFSPPVVGAVNEMVYKELRGLKPDQAKYDEYIATLSTKLDVYDEILGKQKYLAGEEMTLVDLFHLPSLVLERFGSDIMTRSRMSRAQRADSLTHKGADPEASGDLVLTTIHAKDMLAVPMSYLPKDDDGFILYDSRAICRYISIKYRNQGQRLLPPVEDVRATALFEQAAAVEAVTFTQPIAGAINETFYKKLRGLAPDLAKYDEYIATLSTKLDVYDEILGEQKYLLGDEISLVDLLHLSGGTALKIIGSDIMSQKPNVARWFNDLSSRESWQVLKMESRALPE